MSGKNISISQEAYEKLAAWKATGQSFSGAILDLLQQDEKKTNEEEKYERKKC